ncbi:MAG: MFS transporter [Prolixibacteraceae bacterium]|nr:MFS transporter [Prolixibacteraceae bacterium]
MAKITLKEKLGFSLGEYSSSMVWQTLMFFLPIFFTDTYGLSAAGVALMFGVVRFFDAFTDPIMGMIADRTETRWGKFRPFILWLSVPYGIFIVLLFTTPDFSAQGKIIYAYVSYSLMMIMYTAISIPYNSMIGVISPDPVERTSVSSYKFVFAYAAGISVQLLIIPMVRRLGEGNDASGYQITMSYFAVIAVVCFLISFLVSRERVKPDPAQVTNIKSDLKDLTNNKPWVILFFVSLSTLIYIAIRSSATAYYFKYYMGRESEMGIFMAVGTIFLLLGVLPTKWLSEKFGKKRLYIVSMSVIVLSSVMLFFLKPHNIVLVYAVQIIFSAASGPTMPLLWSMLGDAADYSEWKNKRRATGLVFSALTFSQKTGFALGGIMVMSVLAWFGFEANGAQSALSMTGIKLTMTVIPGIVALIGTILLIFYPLTDIDVKKIAVDLAVRVKDRDNNELLK